ncbi:SDR family NAD(P)-dependent oxidoreductase [Aquimarina brevivitae]|uniref:NAD(P)-dependent dehydrogenase (Short-subunit alcohol dehydrogenase family) n=1 Tax=Aquimarina brevivitae TaxID=323412 RepID=A0A4Q7NU15_9FLAO|nr:SDR family oxidoreductase [Aquimarina brevivitae]RZS90676.1 NAD(P)-dependent dehydrogenase (short-subunit alcohol dehydrogenase family) [Aquimarina brevivitae]
MKKNILLIGGSHGIGFEIAMKLYKEHNIYIASRTSENLGNIDVTHINYDASTDEIDTTDLPDTIDGFVYCPGSINLKPFKMLSPKAFEEDMNINFMFLIKIVHDLLPKLKNSKQASLVFFSTVAVKVGMPFHTSIAAAKGAIEGFAKALAAEYAPQFRVNVIAPSLTDTPLAERLLGNDKKKEKMDERHPLKRVGEAEDIANVAKFLLSDESSWITGQILGVDGGMSTLNIN